MSNEHVVLLQLVQGDLCRIAQVLERPLAEQCGYVKPHMQRCQLLFLTQMSNSILTSGQSVAQLLSADVHAITVQITVVCERVEAWAGRTHVS